MVNKCKFIVFEGPHGSGKTTQAKLLKKHFDNKGVPIIRSKEPYLEDLKGVIEKYSLITDEVSSYMLLYLHAADRFAHVKFIKNRLKEGYNVISDRYLFSSIVYQHIQGIPIEFIKQVNSFCITPDIVFILDVPLYERLERLKKNKRLRNNIFFEENNIRTEEKLYQHIYENYKTIWKNTFLVDGKRDMDEISNEILNRLDTI